MKQKLTTIVKWLVLLPAASWLSFQVYFSIVSCKFFFHINDGMLDYLLRIVSSIIAGFVFMFIGIKLTPSHHKVVKPALLILFFAVVIWISVSLLINHKVQQILWYATAPIGSIIGFFLIKSPIQSRVPKKINWGAVLAVFIFLLVYSLYQQNQRNEYNDQMNTIYREQREAKDKEDAIIEQNISKVHDTSLHQIKSKKFNGDSIVQIIKRDMQKYHLVNAAFSKPDSCILLFMDSTYNISKFDAELLFGQLPYDFKIDIAKNITSIIVFRTWNPKQSADKNVSRAIIWSYIRPGSKMKSDFQQTNK